VPQKKKICFLVGGIWWRVWDHHNPLMRGCPCLAVIKSPPGWEVGVYAAGALALLGIAAVSLWKLWTSGNFPSPSPFPNYDYRYLQQKYGESYTEDRPKVRGTLAPACTHQSTPPHPQHCHPFSRPASSSTLPSLFWLLSSCTSRPPLVPCTSSTPSPVLGSQ
jgi:hypothetical protein